MEVGGCLWMFVEVLLAAKWMVSGELAPFPWMSWMFGGYRLGNSISLGGLPSIHDIHEGTRGSEREEVS